MSRILFMGTPEFAAVSLARLYDATFDICAVFTQPDKPKNRGMKLLQPPVKTLAKSCGTPIFQPDRLDGAEVDNIRDIAPDLIVVVAYGKILPPELLALPSFGCINVHASLLPKYRGAAPIQWAILNGDRYTGVTMMQMDKGLDTGDILSMRQTEILPDETSGQLFERLAYLGADLLVDTVPAIFANTAEKTPQDDSLASYAPMLRRELSPIDWTRRAAEIVNQIRGLNPWPSATAELDGQTFKIHAAHVGDGRGIPGAILSAGERGLEIACSDGSVVISELQAPGKKRMSAADYLRGNAIGN